MWHQLSFPLPTPGTLNITNITQPCLTQVHKVKEKEATASSDEEDSELPVRLSRKSANSSINRVPRMGSSTECCEDPTAYFFFDNVGVVWHFFGRR
jgi:hypothetical protein